MTSIKYYKLRLVLGWMYIAGIIVLSLIPNPPQVDPTESDLFAHLFTYFILMIWFTRIQPRDRYPFLAMSFIALGICMEILQGLGGQREFEWIDILANSSGVLTAWVLSRNFQAPVRTPS